MASLFLMTTNSNHSSGWSASTPGRAIAQGQDMPRALPTTLRSYRTLAGLAQPANDNAGTLLFGRRVDALLLFDFEPALDQLHAVGRLHMHRLIVHLFDITQRQVQPLHVET